MKIITSGKPYIDIDAYAGCIAYAELWNLKDQKALVYSSSRLNKSITQTILSWKAPLVTNYRARDEDTFTLVDLSDPNHFDNIVDLKRVEEIIDHHQGYESIWHANPNVITKIEFIGSVCTLIFEIWQSENLVDKISSLSAALMVAAILDNTLNFGAQVSTERDRIAFEKLMILSKLPKGWEADYFSECQELIYLDLKKSIENDVKVLSFETFPREVSFGQLVVWDGDYILKSRLDLVASVLSKIRQDWAINLISIKDNASFFITSDVNVKKWLSGLIDIHFEDNVARANRMWLRKEIMKAGKVRSS